MKLCRILLLMGCLLALAPWHGFAAEGTPVKAPVPISAPTKASATAAVEGASNYKPTKLHDFLTDGTAWLNTSRPLTRDDLAGRLILLDFWTYCCINCIQTIPDLHYLEKRFGPALTVIGVHSAKFTNEKDAENIRKAMSRYGITHPVINDADFKVWKAYGAKAWPTLAVINPFGEVVSAYFGEGHLKDLEKDINRVYKEYGDGKFITSTALPIALEKDKEPASILHFPAKLEVIPDYQGKPGLVVSDSGNNRILIIDKQGMIQASFGSGAEGLKDGAAKDAQFNRPQGIVYGDGYIYVADTGNHALRRIDVKSGEVTTLMGTGQKGFMRMLTETKLKTFSLASPWDVAFFPDKKELMVAMAGSHQLWSYTIESGLLKNVAGSGAEQIIDGVFPANALSQPSGLASLGSKLYFVDAETSSLRTMEPERGEVATLIGKGLFDFGYVEGSKETARMQHPLGIHADDSGIYIADAYNHAVRRYDMNTHALTNFAGTGVRGMTNGVKDKAQFNEPNDIARIGDTLYITDTNNHRIRTLELKSGKVGELAVMPQAEGSAPVLSEFLPNVTALPATKVKPGKVTVTLGLDKGWKLNKEAPSWLALFDEKGAALQSFTRKELSAGTVVLEALPENSTLRLQGTFYYCEEEAGSLCLIKSYDAMLETTPDGPDSLPELVLRKP